MCGRGWGGGWGGVGDNGNGREWGYIVLYIMHGVWSICCSICYFRGNTIFSDYYSYI